MARDRRGAVSHRRTLSLGPRFARARQTLAPAGTQGARALARTIVALQAATLPGLADYEAAIPPTSRAWVRRIGGENLWLWYRASDAELVVVTLTKSPPVPLD